MNRVEPKTLSGFMELMPDDQIVFNQIKNTIEQVYQKHGFYPLDTPTIELSNVLLAKAGGETEKQIYRFNKGDNDLSLRFDLTVPLAKYVAARYNELIFPFKRYQIGKVYRGERPQKGRFREFYQCDIDVIGNESLSLRYDAEIPCIIYDIFKQLNFGDFVIRINNRKILSGFFTSLDLQNEITNILRVVDKIDKIGLNEVKKELQILNIDLPKIDLICDFIKINGTNDEIINRLNQLKINNDTFNEGIKELKFIVDNLKQMHLNDKNYEIDLTIARGLDYYTGTVYETKLIDYPSIGSVCSGGRYDNLTAYYTDKKLPGVGISIGLTRLFYQLMESKIIEKCNFSVADIVILPLTQQYEYIYSFSNQLKKENLRVDIVYLEKFKQLIKYADRKNIPFALIIGDDEYEKNIAVLKNMKTGVQIEVSLDSVIEEYKNFLKEKNC